MSNIFFREAGSGQPIVLLHGFGEDGRIWQAQVPALAALGRVLIPDLPGSGQSPFSESSSSIDAMAEEIAEWLNRLEVSQPVIMLGHSMGGYITMAFAEKFPEKLKAFALVHSTAAADSAEKIEARQKGIAFVRVNGAFAFLKTAIPNLFAPAFRENQPDVVDALVQDARAFSDQAVIAYYEAMIARPNRIPVLEGNTRPVMFLMGTEDLAVPMAGVLDQTHLPLESHVHILEQCGHMAMLEQPSVAGGHFVRFVVQNIG